MQQILMAGVGDHEIKAILTAETESEVSREYPVNLEKR